MRCPKCYGKIDKRTKKCQSCGFNINSVNGATHKAVRQARKDGFGDDVMYTEVLPSDIKKKKLLLLCIFLGIFGAHSFYAGNYWKASYSLIFGLNMSILALIITITRIPVSLFSDVMLWYYSFSLLFMGINLIMWILDIINISRNKYKVSVYKDEFSNY